jgi:choline dehydrogenase-like flavoprotein
VQLGGRTVPHPRGKVVGGSTALNFLVFNRGAKDEYDAWAEIGNDGWDWANILSSFQSSYNWTPMIHGEEFPSGLNATDANSLDQAYVGSGGVIQVRLYFWHRTSQTHILRAL